MTTAKPDRIALIQSAGPWVTGALCRDVPVTKVNFFPDATNDKEISAAKRVCARCTVQEECLKFAVTNKIADGVWGGLSEADRKALRRRKRNAAPTTSAQDSRCPGCRSRKFVSPRGRGKFECLGCDITWYAAT